jgi:radical SAM superfamily enzyme YgiQ (UPF0313 family)
MNALLVHPSIPETFFSFKHAVKFLGKKAAHVPLGLLTIAAMLPRDWSLRVVDMNIETLTDEDIKWADMVFIGAMIIQKGAVRRLTSRCKVLGKPVVAGGPLFSSNPEEFKEIDHLVLNEAEVTLPLFLEDLAVGKPKSIYSSNLKPDITYTPLPRWDLLKMAEYASMSIQYSRGCPFDCEFCDIVKLNGRRPRVKSNDQMMREVHILYDLGWRGRVFVVDDNFIGNKAKAKSFLRRLIPWQELHQYPFMLFTQASVNLALDNEMITLMTSAGFNLVFLGLETPAEESLAECGKHQNRSVNLVEAVKTIQHHGIEVMGGFIIGFDNDPKDIFERQIRFIQNSGVVKATISLLNAIPGTRLYNRLKEEGRILDNCTGDNCDGSLNFIPKMDARTIREGYQAVLNYIYSPQNYYNRVIKFLTEYRPVRRRRLEKSEVKAFLNSILYLGFLDKGESKLYYWKLLIMALLFHRKNFGEAVSNAIFGYHFRKLFIWRRIGFHG